MSNLESERLSSAYLAYSPSARQRTAEQARVAASENMKAAQQARRSRELSRLLKIYYDAGRYAAGDRDDDAIDAFSRMFEREKRGAKLTAK
jgi:hypothetical protein